jgi:hypothetical protein
MKHPSLMQKLREDREVETIVRELKKPKSRQRK